MVELDSLRFQSDRRVRFCQMLPGLVCVAVVVAVGLAPALAHGPEGNTTIHVDGRYVVMRREGEGHTIRDTTRHTTGCTIPAQLKGTVA